MIIIFKMLYKIIRITAFCLAATYCMSS